MRTLRNKFLLGKYLCLKHLKTNKLYGFQCPGVLKTDPAHVFSSSLIGQNMIVKGFQYKHLIFSDFVISRVSHYFLNRAETPLERRALNKNCINHGLTFLYDLSGSSYGRLKLRNRILV